MPLLALGALATTACSSSTSPSDPEIDPAAQDHPGSPEPASPGSKTDPAAAPGTDPAPPKPVRPEPESTIRSCGAALTAPTKLTTYTQWQQLDAYKIGSQFIAGIGPSTAIWAGGAAVRNGVAKTTTFKAEDDLGVGEAMSGLQLNYNDPLSGSAASAFKKGNPELWHVAPSSRILTSVTVRGTTEVDWSITAPQRTAATSKVSTDRFVRGLVAGSFFGYEVVLVMPSDCAVGALSDALKKPAFVGTAATSTGIFDPATMPDVQDVLVKNGVTMAVRVIANKRNTAVETLLGATACSPGDLAACASLLKALGGEDNKLVVALSATPSVLSAVEAGTDPAWSTIRVSTAAVSILEP